MYKIAAFVGRDPLTSESSFSICISLYHYLDHIEAISAYRNAANDDVLSDICDGSVYKSKITEERIVTLAWHIDGAPTIKSKTLNIWLITGFIVELPISLRFCLSNIILCGLWYGAQKPDFELFQLHFVREVKLEQFKI